MPAAPGFTPALVSVVGRPSRRAGITRASQGRPARRAGPFLPGLQKGPPNFFFRRMSPPFLLTLVSPPSAPAFTTLAHPRVGAGAGVTGVGAGSDMEGRGGRLGGGGGGESRDRRLAQTEKKKGEEGNRESPSSAPARFPVGEGGTRATQQPAGGWTGGAGGSSRRERGGGGPGRVCRVECEGREGRPAHNCAERATRKISGGGRRIRVLPPSPAARPGASLLRRALPHTHPP